MKKNLMFFLCTLAALSLPVLTTSCSDDDDNGGSSNPSGNAAVITTSDGEQLLLTSIGGEFTYRYDNTGRLIYADGDNTYYLSYDPFEIDCEDYDEVSFAFNGAYVSKVTFSDEDDDDVDNGSWTCTYDGSGHITKIVFSYKESWTDSNGKSRSWSEEGTDNLTWSNGNLTKASVTWSEKGEDGSYSGTETYTYEYGNEANEYKQPTWALAWYGYSDWDIVGDFVMVGYFGKGTSDLPTSVKCVYTDDDEDYSETISFSYTKNDNGTIHTERDSDWGTLYYSYANVSSDDTRSTFLTEKTKPAVKHQHGHRHTHARHSLKTATEE
ncbi:MAG: hypothetical protein LUC22_03350 [Prevotella sp.]|nr:hypothetical protein [Prevotella sp.]